MYCGRLVCCAVLMLVVSFVVALSCVACVIMIVLCCLVFVVFVCCSLCDGCRLLVVGCRFVVIAYWYSCSLLIVIGYHGVLFVVCLWVLFSCCLL